VENHERILPSGCRRKQVPLPSRNAVSSAFAGESKAEGRGSKAVIWRSGGCSSIQSKTLGPGQDNVQGKRRSEAPFGHDAGVPLPTEWLRFRLRRPKPAGELAGLRLYADQRCVAVCCKPATGRIGCACSERYEFAAAPCLTRVASHSVAGQTKRFTS